jgi:acyl-CoA oxidase
MWPGDLGCTSSHAGVFAQLEVDGAEYGPQCFVIPIRDITTHRPLPGIEVGDIGPKYGFDTKDNGYLRMTNVRVPRRAMLSRYLSINEKNEVTMQGDPKVVYSIMMYVRLSLLSVVQNLTACSLTIAIRYSCMRTQFKTVKNNKEERPIIDYQTHQYRITNALSFYFSVIFAKKEMTSLYEKMLRGI